LVGDLKEKAHDRLGPRLQASLALFICGGVFDMRKEKKCVTCGKEKQRFTFRSTGRNNQIYEYDNCDTCRRRLKNDPDKLIIQKRKKIKCIYDPTESYSGSWFTRTVFRETLRAGYWPPGSQWKYGYDADVFMVKGNDLFMDNNELQSYPQRLVKVA